MPHPTDRSVMSNFWHMGLTVSDLDRSLAYYRDVVGMELLLGPYDGGGAGMAELMHNPGLEVRYCWLGHDGLKLQLLEYTAQAGTVLELQHNNVGSPHLAFVVDDVDAKRAEVIRDHPEVAIDSPIVDMGVSRTFYTLDPDGLPVEFWQWKVVPADPVMALGGPGAGVRK
jgi:catechol 2,3-dioxygenase-like lactoylglutathione lyase family enzyme